MKVADIMTRQVISVRPDTRVGEIARIFREYSLSGLPVVTADGDLEGIITELDMVKRHARPQMPDFLPLLGVYVPLRTKEYRESLRRITGVVAQDIMTTPVNTITPEASIEDAATVMVSNRSNPLPVVDEGGKMIGIISRTDILRVFEDLDLQLEAELEEGDEEAAAVK
jgi:CBS domain-containing protein